MSFYTDKKVLVTGGTGLIGVPLVQKLVKLGAKVTIVSTDPIERFELIKNRVKEFKDIWYYSLNLEDYTSCLAMTAGMDYVFQLAGSKGSVNIGHTKAATFLTSHLLINLNMLKAAQVNNVKKFLLTSTVGVYSPDSSYKEDEVWKGYPNESDKYSAWAKRVSELAAEAFFEEYKWGGIIIVRPGNTYGPWDNFDRNTAMVVGSLVDKFATTDEILNIHGDGIPVRDFTYSEDIADGMILALEKCWNCESFNLSIGKGYSIKELVDQISYNFSSRNTVRKYKFLQAETGIKNERVLNIDKAKELLEFNPKVELEEGISKTVAWHLQNKDIVNIRYNAFNK